MKNGDINWDKVDVVINPAGKEMSDNILHDVQHAPFRLKYQVLRYIDHAETEWYRLDAFLPFSFKSAWIKTEQEVNCKGWEAYALERLNSALRAKYSEIKKRDAKNRQRFFAFKELIGGDAIDEEKARILYATCLNHGEDHDYIDDTIKETVGDLRNKLDKIASDPVENQDCKLNYAKFVKMLVNDKCHYCDISVEQILKLSEKYQLFTKRSRGYCMEVDQLNAYDFYHDDNCEASCYWCNNAKTDEFSDIEFQKTKPGFKAIWYERLENRGL